jgi:hypothetical protein
MSRIIKRLGGGIARRVDVREIDRVIESATVGRANRTTAGVHTIDRWRDPGRYRGPFAWSLHPTKAKTIKIGQGFIRIGDAWADWPTKLQATGAWPIATPDEYSYSGLAAGDYVLYMVLGVDYTTHVFNATSYPHLNDGPFSAFPPTIFEVSPSYVVNWPIMSFTITAAGGIRKPLQRQHGDIIFPVSYSSATGSRVASSFAPST